MNKFGKLLRWYRNRSGVSQTWLAKACGVSSRKVIQCYEHGRRRPAIGTFVKLAVALDLSTEDREQLYFARLRDELSESASQEAVPFFERGHYALD